MHNDQPALPPSGPKWHPSVGPGTDGRRSPPSQAEIPTIAPSDSNHRPFPNSPEGHAASVAGRPSAPPRFSPTDSGSAQRSLPPSAGAGGRAGPSEFPNVAGYHILGELGRGGMGVVYKARQVGLDRIVALKMVLGGASADPRDLERFRNEANAVAQLAHPNFVQIYDVGDHNGQPYITLEFVDGGSLSSRTAGTPQPPRLAAQLVETLARAMFVAHQARIIHRDLKPANVLLTAAGVPKIADFGLAKRLDSQADLTGTGAMVGSPNYMSPEAALGKIREIGPAADIYGLGAILYALLTGRAPFVGKSLMHTLMLVGTTDPIPPSQLAQGLPTDLETICLKAMHREPTRRYPTAHDLAEDLQRWQTGQPISARPVGLLERARKWARRRPAAAALVAVAFLGTVALALLTGKLADTNSRLKTEANLVRAQSLEAEAQRERANKSADEARRNADAAEENWHTARAKEEEARLAEQRAKSALVTAEAAQQQAETSRLLLLRETGVLLCREGKPGAGLARLVEALRSPSWAKNGVERSRLLRLFAGWARGQPQLVGQYDLERLLARDLGGIEQVQVSPDGRRLAILGSKRLRVLDLETRTVHGNEWNHKSGDSFRSVAWSADGRLLAVGTTFGDGKTKPYEGRIHFWRTDNEQPAAKSFVVQGQSYAAIIGQALAKGRQFNPEPSFKALKFSRDGQRLLAGGGNDSALLLDVSDIAAAAGSPNPPQKLPEARIVGSAMDHGGKFGVDGHYAYVASVDLSPDDRLAVTGSTAGTIRVWSLADGQPALPMALGHDGQEIRAVAFSPCGRFIVSGGHDSYLRFWNTTTGRPAAAPIWHKRPVRDLAFGDARTLITGSDDFAARLWDVSELSAALAAGADGLTPTVRPLSEPLEHDERVAGVSFFDHGQHVVTTDNRTLRIWWRDSSSAATLTEPPLAPAAGAGAVSSLRWDSTGQTLWAAHADTSVRRWAVVNRSLRLPVPVSRAIGSPTKVTVKVDAIDAGVGDVAKSLRLTGEPNKPLAAVSADSDRAILLLPHVGVSLNSTLKSVTYMQLWQPSNGEKIGSPAQLSFVFDRAALSPDGRLAAVCRKTTLLVLDLASGQVVRDWLEKHHKIGMGPDTRITAIAFSDSSRLLAVGEQGGDLAVLQMGGPIVDRPLRKLDPGLPVVQLQFARRDGVLLVATGDGAVRRWDVQSGQPLGDAIAHSAAVAAVAENANGDCLAVACVDGTVWFWDAETGLPLGRPFRLEHAPTALSFSPDGSRLAVGLADGSILLLALHAVPRDDPDALANWLTAQFGVAIHNGREARSDRSDRQKAFETLRAAPIWTH